MTDTELCALAKEMRKFSHAPYSHYSVGAALECASGKVFTGCNIENSAFSPSVCAERTAFFKAISEGEREFVKIAVAGGNTDSDKLNGSITPCGVCRQVMSEFCGEDFRILLVRDDNEFKIVTLAEMLPCAFGSENLK